MSSERPASSRRFAKKVCSRCFRAARRTLEVDAKRTKDATLGGLALVQRMLPSIENDPRWNAEYEQFVDRVAFGPEDQRFAFDAAITACRRLVALVLDGEP
jgi:hypothetical protein